MTIKELIDFLSEFTRTKKKKISEETRICEDLGINGDDVDDLFEELMFYNGTQIRACYELYTRLPTEKKETVYSEWIELKRILPHPIKTYFDGKLVY